LRDAAPLIWPTVEGLQTKFTSVASDVEYFTVAADEVSPVRVTLIERKLELSNTV
jgi:hypothetical protein